VCKYFNVYVLTPGIHVEREGISQKSKNTPTKSEYKATRVLKLNIIEKIAMTMVANGVDLATTCAYLALYNRIIYSKVSNCQLTSQFQ
jgi:hypothetical protein